MPAIALVVLIAAVVVIGLIVVSVLGFALHFLFSPWLLVAIAILAWIKFRPRRAGR
jgi:hypothetical protein